MCTKNYDHMMYGFWDMMCNRQMDRLTEGQTDGWKKQQTEVGAPAKNYSKSPCFRHLTDRITIGFQKGLFNGIILIDLQKVLDPIEHQILLKKMKFLSFSKNPIA